MKNYGLFLLLSLITGSPISAIFLLFIIYFVIDKLYLGFFPDLLKPLKRNQQIRVLKNEIHLNPSNANALQELGILHFETRKYEKAIELFEKAEQKIDRSARLSLYMGMTYMKLNNYEEGKTYLEQAIGIDESVGYGIAYIYLLEYALALNMFDPPILEEWEAGFRRFANTENFYKMGIIYKQQKQYQKAKDMFENAINDYRYIPKSIRRLHRKWWILSRIQKVSVNSQQ
jgi:tetratricopeptide (TPR) repeat protein